MNLRCIQWVLSLVFVSLGQSAQVPFYSVLAAGLGIALFWTLLLQSPFSFKQRFWVATFWFFLVQLVQLSWFTSSEYMGLGIWVVYVGLSLVLGLQFGVLTFFFPQGKWSLIHCLAMSSAWVLLEWTRLSFFTGFTWNPLGLSLADSSLAIQWASVLGVYGLSFWVVLVNALCVSAVGSKKRAYCWAFCMAWPYLFGWGQAKWVDTQVFPKKTLSVALVQTGILPEQKDLFPDRRGEFIPYLDQWVRIWDGLKECPQVDLIVFPEATVGAGATIPVYPASSVAMLWEESFGEKLDLFSDLPLSNLSLAQTLSQAFGADIILGLDDHADGKAYNAAFHLRPDSSFLHRYEKRVLTPVGEYIPLAEIRLVSDFLLSQFGIGASFDSGNAPGLYWLSQEVPAGVSICLEETYSQLIREERQKGAELFVNISNDVWFPSSRLPYQHFQHGRLRAAEHGVPVLRACNTGITGAIDCCGRVLKTAPLSEDAVSVLVVDLPLKSFSTLYTVWGDFLILSCSVFFLLVYSAVVLRAKVR